MKLPHVVWAAMLVACCCACAAKKDAVSARSKEHPNVLFIAVDDLNTLSGVLGGYADAKTPNLDRLAARGVTFSNAHCQAPLCGPSRASIMTGLRPSTTGIYGMIPDEKIRSENPATKEILFLPEYFSTHGYRTMGIGKLFHTHAPKGVLDESGGREKGFGPLPPERFVWDGFGTSDRKRYGRTSTDWGPFPAADSLMPDHRSVDWVIDRLERDYDSPFFMALGLLRVHVPLYVPQKWFDLYPLEDISTPVYHEGDLNDVPPVAMKINDLPMMPTTEWAIRSGEWPKIIQAYLACISFVDNEIGRVLDALDRSGHADDTVIVLWSDHGYRLGEKGTFAKHALWEPATRVPMMFAAPDLPRGKVIDDPAELLSVYPTLLELCGLPQYSKNEGESLVPVMKGERSSAHAVAITTHGMNNHAVRTERFRYIRYEDGAEELYDHTTDPDELINLAGQPQYAGEIEKIKAYLPRTNALWDANSSYTFQPYFVEQKARTSSPERNSNPMQVSGQLTNYDLAKITSLREQIRNNRLHQELYRRTIRDADKLMKAPLSSVMQKTVMPPSGDMHDYISLAPYWWPDPNKPDGLPWIRKDGEVNPLTKDGNTDNQAKSRTWRTIGKLALVAWLSGDEKYGKRAVEQINTWFLDPDTKMNPNLNFGQGIPGRNDGRCFGIIETTAIQDIVDALELLELGKMLPERTKKGMHTWLNDFVGWLQTSKLGVEEGTRPNNHATWYDVQVVCLLRYLGREEEAREVLKSGKSRLIDVQIEADGSQPHELARTKSISYSTMNLRGMTRLAWHGRHLGVDLWNYQNPAGGSIRAAYDYLKPYAFDGKKWEYQQLGDKEHHLKSLRNLFYRTGGMMNVEAYCRLRAENEDPPDKLEDVLFACPDA
ncbi:sulfatase-like hydrolase/transferase [Neolewinella aurantiaca]|uniref:Sulfatase-like hydrolase/transferase n=1 Tax=Neolewinella aurantiaca TaxID=2602767 RepID=A0A5C7FK07_9BACT|nr:alginate lyase family protein [Neolewinella aurantiaca]TXF90243.1 sulfatase-like hydrolase/transferase [Neolewinella aurantiaca]